MLIEKREQRGAFIGAEIAYQLPQSHIVLPDCKAHRIRAQPIARLRIDAGAAGQPGRDGPIARTRYAEQGTEGRDRAGDFKSWR